MFLEWFCWPQSGITHWMGPKWVPELPTTPARGVEHSNFQGEVKHFLNIFCSVLHHKKTCLPENCTEISPHCCTSLSALESWERIIVKRIFYLSLTKRRTKSLCDESNPSQMGDFGHSELLAEGVLIGCCKNGTWESSVARVTLLLTTGTKKRQSKWI